MVTDSAGTDVNCNHGTWNETAHTCDCDDGWCTDWVDQDVLGGKFVYCNSRASTPSPNNSTTATRSLLAGKSTFIIVILAVALAASCGIVVFCCYRKKRRLKEQAKQEEILAAATKDREAWLQEGVQLQQMQAQERAALGQQAWIAQLETQRQDQAMMEQLMSMSAMEATSNPQLSKLSRHRQRPSPEMLPPQSGVAPCACNAVYEGGNSSADTFVQWSSQEPFAQSHNYYRHGATLSTTDGYTDYSKVFPPYYTSMTVEMPERGLHSPQYAHPTSCRPPF